MANTGFLYYRICITVSVWVLLSQGWVNLSGWMNGTRNLSRSGHREYLWLLAHDVVRNEKPFS